LGAIGHIVGGLPAFWLLDLASDLGRRLSGQRHHLWLLRDICGDSHRQHGRRRVPGAALRALSRCF
jgi:hypothetical protein